MDDDGARPINTSGTKMGPMHLGKRMWSKHPAKKVGRVRVKPTKVTINRKTRHH